MAGIHITEVEKVSAWLRRQGDLAVAAMGAATKRVLDQVARQERTLLSLGYHPPGTPTGSVPPSPPWRVSGELSRHTEVVGPILKRKAWVGKVGNTRVYARIHELGGVTGRGHRTHLPPRPFLRPAWRIVRPTIKATYEHELRKALHL